MSSGMSLTLLVATCGAAGARFRAGIRHVLAPVGKAEDGGHHEQRGGGCEQQAAYNRAAQRRVLLRVLSAVGPIPMIMAKAVIRTGRKRVAPASMAAWMRGHAGRHPLTREADDQDGVGGGNTHAHDGACQRRDGERGAGEEQHPDDARQCAPGKPITITAGSVQLWKLTTISR